MADLVMGRCVGGVLDGQTIASKPDQPFVATDRRENRVWVYQWDGNAFAVVTDHDSSLLLPGGAETGERALDWERLDQSPLTEIPAVDVEENHAGPPVDDGWPDPA